MTNLALMQVLVDRQQPVEARVAACIKLSNVLPGAGSTGSYNQLAIELKGVDWIISSLLP